MISICRCSSYQLGDLRVSKVMAIKTIVIIRRKIMQNKPKTPVRTHANATIGGKAIISSPYGAYGVCVFILPSTGARFCSVFFGK